MKHLQKAKAVELRDKGYSINEIAKALEVAKSSVSIWVREVRLTDQQLLVLNQKPFTSSAIEKRRSSRLASELRKRNQIQLDAKRQVVAITKRELWLIGAMLYWAEGGKTQRMVRFSNGDPQMIRIMMRFFREVCGAPEEKIRGYIHIHHHLDHKSAEKYWSRVANIPPERFFKTYRKPNKSSQSKRNSLPYGVLDIYVLDTRLFLKISGWVEGIFSKS